MKKLPLIFMFLVIHLQASKHSVDISFLIADLKYSQENGVKICEIQQGSLSAFTGDVFLNGGVDK